MLKKDFTHKKYKGGKLKERYLGPYTITKVLPHGTYELSDESTKIRATGAHLKLYTLPSPLKHPENKTSSSPSAENECPSAVSSPLSSAEIKQKAYKRKLFLMQERNFQWVTTPHLPRKMVVLRITFFHSLKVDVNKMRNFHFSPLQQRIIHTARYPLHPSQTRSVQRTGASRYCLLAAMNWKMRMIILSWTQVSPSCHHQCHLFSLLDICHFHLQLHWHAVLPVFHHTLIVWPKTANLTQNLNKQGVATGEGKGSVYVHPNTARNLERTIGMEKGEITRWKKWCSNGDRWRGRLALQETPM